MLTELQAAELDILKQVIVICKNHDIVYYAVGGTLLGAIRHGGFIPWDDDIDIAMPRPDYNRFVEIAMKELQAPYQLNTIDNMPNGFCYYYARAENQSVLLERNATKKKAVVPAWVDIFPLDGVPSDEVNRNRWFKNGAFWKNIFNLSQYSFLAADSTQKKSILNQAIYSLKIDRFISTKFAWKQLNKVIIQYDYEKNDNVTNFCGRYGMKEITRKDTFGEGFSVPFEDISINAPADYDAYLTQIYGNYMEPPLEKDRIRHNIKLFHSDNR